MFHVSSWRTPLQHLWVLKTLGVGVVLLVVSIPIAMHVVLAFIKDGTFSLSLEHGGVKFGADADFVPVGSLAVCSPRSCGVPPEVSGASRCRRGALPGKCHIHYERGYIVGGSFSQADVVCLPRPCGGPPLAQSAFRCCCGVWAECDFFL